MSRRDIDTEAGGDCARGGGAATRARDQIAHLYRSLRPEVRDVGAVAAAGGARAAADTLLVRLRSAFTIYQK